MLEYSPLEKKCLWLKCKCYLHFEIALQQNKEAAYVG